MTVNVHAAHKALHITDGFATFDNNVAQNFQAILARIGLGKSGSAKRCQEKKKGKSASHCFSMAPLPADGSA